MRTAGSLLSLALFGGALAMAGTICPAGNGATPFPYNPDNAATGCNAVITIAANGSATTVVKDTTPYEESEDVMIGVVNNSGTVLGTMNITGSASIPIFGFDGDGICTFTFVGSTYCTASQKAGTDPGDYDGPTSTFTNISSNQQTGTVNFSPAIAANGGTTYFSLEGIPTASLTITTTSTPAPPALLLLLIGLAALGMWQLGRRFAGRAI